MDTLTKPISAPRRRTTADTVYPILLLVSVTHLLNDMMQSVIPAVYPLLKAKFGFSFAQIGLITLVFQMTSSILQPFVGRYADRHPRPYSLAAGMCFTLAGLFALALAPGFAPILLAVALIGWGSSIFHPESSRVAQLASGGRKGLAQSIFQVGGNAGSAFGPLLAALVVIPYGQTSIMWFAPAALLAIGILLRIGNWYKRQLNAATAAPVTATAAAAELPRRKIRRALLILTVLVFSKYFYIACMTNYFTFFLMDKFAFSVQDAQYSLFAFLAASAAGTVIGGPLGDRIGRKYVIWGSILGAAPFALMLPYAGSGSAVALALFTALAAVLSVVAGLRSRSFTLGCLTFAGCCAALTVLFLLRSSWLTEGFSAVLSALCLFAPFEEFVNNNFSIPTLVYYLTVTVLFLFFTVQELEKRRWN